MSTQEPREIAFEDIKKGDDIEVVWEMDDRTDTTRGIADHKAADGWWWTRGGRALVERATDGTILLRHRTAPAEPKGMGAVVRARVGGVADFYVRTPGPPGDGGPDWADRTGNFYYWSDFAPDSIEKMAEGIEEPNE